MKGLTGAPTTALFLYIAILRKSSSEIKCEIMVLRSLKFTSAEDFYLNMEIEHVFISIPS